MVPKIALPDHRPARCARDLENRGGSQGFTPRMPQVVESAWPGVKVNAGQQGTRFGPVAFYGIIPLPLGSHFR